MKIKDLSDYCVDEVPSLMHRIPFFKELLHVDKQQFNLLMQHSCIVELEPAETIMRRGDKGTWLYFLIKGRLSVYIDPQDNHEPINHITPGELFGDLALLCDQKRKATVVAEKNSKYALLFATNFNVFGDLQDFNTVNIATKLLFYRTMVHSIRWRLEVNRMESPKHLLSERLRQVPVFKGDKGGVEELTSLSEQARFLATLLDDWNSGGITVQELATADQSDRSL